MFFTWKFSRWTPDRGGVRSFGQRLVTGTQLGELEDDLVGSFVMGVSVGCWWGVFWEIIRWIPWGGGGT